MAFKMQFLGFFLNTQSSQKELWQRIRQRYSPRKQEQYLCARSVLLKISKLFRRRFKNQRYSSNKIFGRNLALQKKKLFWMFRITLTTARWSESIEKKGSQPSGRDLVE